MYFEIQFLFFFDFFRDFFYFFRAFDLELFMSEGARPGENNEGNQVSSSDYTG